MFNYKQKVQFSDSTPVKRATKQRHRRELFHVDQWPYGELDRDNFKASRSCGLIWRLQLRHGFSKFNADAVPVLFLTSNACNFHHIVYSHLAAVWTCSTAAKTSTRKIKKGRIKYDLHTAFEGYKPTRNKEKNMFIYICRNLCTPRQLYRNLSIKVRQPKLINKYESRLQ